MWLLCSLEEALILCSVAQVSGPTGEKNYWGGCTRQGWGARWHQKLALLWGRMAVKSSPGVEGWTVSLSTSAAGNAQAGPVGDVVPWGEADVGSHILDNGATPPVVSNSGKPSRWTALSGELPGGRTPIFG